MRKCTGNELFDFQILRNQGFAKERREKFRRFSMFIILILRVFFPYFYLKMLIQS